MHKNKLFYQNSIEIKGKFIGGSDPLVMGIINLTPDSFYSVSRKQSENEILKTAEKMLSEGADVLDLGAYSSRPQAINISLEEEWGRLKEVLRVLRRNFPDPILSVDTFRAGIAEKALNEGVDIINDISGGNLDPDMFALIAHWNCPYILMHMKGTPQTMQTMNQYSNMMEEIYDYFKQKIEELSLFNFNKIIIDPGFGFAKNIEQNFELLSKAALFKKLEKPLLIGISRKSMIYKSLHIEVDDALNGTTALNMFALQNGANLLRVHDVKEAVECVNLWKKLNQYA